jgi:DnaK suppressor protein
MTARKSATQKRVTKAAAGRSTAGKAKIKAVKATATTAKPKVVKAKVTKAKTTRANGKTTATGPAAGKTATVKKPVSRRPFKLSSKESKRFEELLLTERQKLMREMGYLENTVLNRSMRESSGDISGYSHHMADVGTDSMEREKAFLFASVEGRALLNVNEALRRLYNGQYGLCEVCSSPVGTERLEVVPHARLCVSCKEAEERSQSGQAR